jgi:hypothetical protein
MRKAEVTTKDGEDAVGCLNLTSTSLILFDEVTIII